MSSRALALILALLLPSSVFAEASSSDTTLSGAQIAESTYGFLQKLVDEDMPAVQSYDCKDGGCIPVDESRYTPQLLAWSLLADSSMQKTKPNDLYLNRINTKMDYLMKACYDEVNNCRGYEIYVNDATCIASIMQVYDAYSITKKPEHRDFLVGVGSCSTGATMSLPMIEAIYSRESALISQIHPNVKKVPYYSSRARLRLGWAESRLPQSLTHYQDGGFEFKQSACWVQLAKLELYKATGNESYLSQVKEFFGGAKLNEHLSGDPSLSLSVQDIGSCSESLLNLYDITKDSAYKREAHSLSQYLLDRYWDSPYNGVVSADGGFFAVPSNVQENRKLISDNAYIIYLFNRQAGDSFKVASVKAPSTTVSPASAAPSPLSGVGFIIIVIITIAILYFLSKSNVYKKGGG
ncbi:MAG: hypothetical protein V1744_02145 [Candidatus Altiarchaeota archaeon]